MVQDGHFLREAANQKLDSSPLLPSEGCVQDYFRTLAAPTWLDGRLFSDSLLALGMSDDDKEAAPDRQLLSRASTCILQRR
jgi:hypothetical protein